MSVVVKRKTKTILDKIVRDGLSAALSAAEIKTAGFNSRAVGAISRLLVDRLMVDTQFIDCVSSLSPSKNREFITTQEAARLSGFSRPVIVALLESDIYPGAVTRTPKGHRRVERGEFVAWLKATSVPKDLPKTVREVRSGPRDEAPKAPKAPKAENEAQRVERARRLDAARSLGAF
jgi:hypothetical protein